MAVQGNFETVFNEIFCSDLAARDALTGLVVEKLYDKVDLDQLFTVISPVATGDPAATLTYNAVYNAVKNTPATDCTIGTCDVSPEYASKVWAIAIAECRITLCTRALTPKFLAAWGKYKRVNPESDEYDFAVNQVAEMAADLIANTLLAKLWLSDTTLQTVPGTVADVLDAIDGFLVQIQPATDHMVDAGASPLKGEDLYKKIVDALDLYADNNVWGSTLENAKIYMDRSDARSLVGWLNGAGRNSGYDCTCIDPEGVVRADRYTVEGLTIHGLPVIVQPFEDMMSQFDEYSIGGVPNFHNLVVITPQENLQVGTPNRDDLAELDYFYDRKDRTYYFDIGYAYGAMVPTDHFTFVLGEKDNGGDGGDGGDGGTGNDD